MRKSLLVLILAGIMGSGGILTAAPAMQTWNLEDCVHRALNTNKDYLIAKLTVTKKEAEVQAAFAGLLPSLSFSGSYTRLNEAVTIMGFPFSSIHNTSLGLALSYPIPFVPYFSDGAWGAANKAHDIAKENLRIAREQLRKIRIETRVKVAKQFYMVLLSRKVLSVTKANQKRLQAYEGVAQRNYQAGRVNQYELLRTQVQLANNTPLLLQAENNLRLARVGLLQVMGLSLDTAFRLKGGLDLPKIHITEKQALDIALKNRYEFRELSGTQRILKATRNLQKASRRPTLAAFGNISWDQAGDSMFSGSFEHSWNVGLQLSLPISELFPWSKTKGNVKAAEIDLTIIGKTRDKVEDLIRLEIRQLVLRMEEHSRTIKAQKVAIDLSTRGLGIARVRFANGQMGNVELMDAELDYQQAQVNYFSASYKYITDKYDLLQAIGRENLKE